LAAAMISASAASGVLLRRVPERLILRVHSDA
jgi:hypothetical protein